MHADPARATLRRGPGIQRWHGALVLGLVLAVLAACTPAPSTTGPSASKPAAPAAGAPAASQAAPATAAGPAQTASAPPLQTVKISVPGASLSYLPAKVAVDMGLYEQEGLQVEFVQLGGDLAVAAIISGQAEFTTLTSAAMAAIARGADLKTVQYQSVKIVHAMMGRPEVATVADLTGKKIGVQRLGDLTAFEANWVIERNNLRDVAVLQVGAEQERMAAVLTGAVDATFLARPWDLKAEQEGLRRLLNMWEVLDMAQVGLVTTTDTLRQQEAMVRRLMRANNRAAAVVRDPARRQEVGAIVARWMEISPAEAERVVAELRDTYPANGLASDEAVNAFMDVLRGSDAIPANATVAQMVDFTLAREVAREMGLLQ